MSDLAPVYDALKKADAAGNSTDAKRLADYIRSSSAPGKENPLDAAAQRENEIASANRAANATPERLPGFSEIPRMLGAIPAGAASTARAIGTVVEHPLEAVTGLVKKIPGALSTAGDVIAHPIDSTKKVGEYLKGLQPEQAGEMVGSMAMGGAAGKAVGVLGDVAGPSVKALIGAKPVSPVVRDLASKGVVTTPGMRGGRMAAALEDKLTSDPVAGESIRTAKGKAIDQWNRSDLNEAIKDAGGKPLPKNRTGRDAIFHAETEIKSAYGRVIPKMKGSLDSPDPAGVTFRQQISNVAAGNRKLDAAHSKLVHDIIDDDVVAKFKNAGGHAAGETLKEIQETLRTEADGLRRGTYQERQAAVAIDQIRTHFMDMLKRENPKIAPELDRVDTAYAKFKTISRASQYSKKGEGSYTPAQKLRSISAKDKSKDRQRFASGRAPGQRETEAVERVLGNTYPDSGTAGRVAALDAIKHPVKALTSGVLSAGYSQPVLKILQNRALKKGGPYTPISGKKAATVGAILGARDE